MTQDKPKLKVEDQAVVSPQRITITLDQRAQYKVLIKTSGMDAQQQERFTKTLCDILSIDYFGPLW